MFILKTALISFLIFVALIGDIYATPLEKIKKEYKQTIDAIKAKAFYENHFVVNQTDKSWRALGNHKVRVTWYYSDTLGDAEKYLRYVVVSKHYAAHRVHFACLYKAPCDLEDPSIACKARPIFCHDKRDIQDNESAGPTNHRFYWSKGKLLMLRRGKVQIKHLKAIDKKQAKHVYQRAIELRKRFAKYETL